MSVCGNHRIPKPRCVTCNHNFFCTYCNILLWFFFSILNTCIIYNYNDLFKSQKQLFFLSPTISLSRTTAQNLSAVLAASSHPSTSLRTKAISAMYTARTLKTTFCSTAPTALTMATKRLWKHTLNFSTCPITLCGRAPVVWRELVGSWWRTGCWREAGTVWNRRCTTAKSAPTGTLCTM